jgi:hypothetical protein
VSQEDAEGEDGRKKKKIKFLEWSYVYVIDRFIRDISDWKSIKRDADFFELIDQKG